MALRFRARGQGGVAADTGICDSSNQLASYNLVTLLIQQFDTQARVRS